MRQFLAFASKNTIEDVQAFTAQWAPKPTWVRTEEIDIPETFSKQAAEHLQAELGPEGLHAIGGRTWWQWRQEDNQLRAEWIEMQKDHDLRRKRNTKCQRSMLYVHGGAYYFGSVDAHRYQMQRHARKLQARILAPRYRLAPQFPFPCGLMDCLAAYKYLLTIQDPETIVLAGDSAGGGMVLSMLVLIRDQGLPTPAGAILLSPWVDLTHSFPSVAGTNTLDYVPADGFHHKPSMSWPPPNADELASLDDVMIEMEHGKQVSAKALRQQAQDHAISGMAKGKGKESAGGAATVGGDEIPIKPDGRRNLFCAMNGKPVEIKDQIQFYTTNELLAHPLVSPIMQASLGGLPPLCILTGGGEMLRDEQIYLAHKAADPAAYPPPSQEDYADDILPHQNLMNRATINTAIARYPPSYVQLQIWDDLCHVPTTLSWTRPAKYMFRSVAQFGAWAFARAQMSEIRILDDDDISIISTESSESSDSEDSDKKRKRSMQGASEPEKNDKRVQSGLYRPTTPRAVGRAGDPLPLFKDHMIRHRVTRHGDLYALDPPSMLPATTMPTVDVGTIKQGPVEKWLNVQKSLASRFGDVKRDVQEKRLQQIAETTGGRGMIFTAGREDTMLIGEEHPPPTALAGRSEKHIKAMGLLKKQKGKASKGLAMWSGWGSKHDEDAIEKEEHKMNQKEDVTMAVVNVRRRQSMNLLGSGPIAGGGPLDAEGQGSSSSAAEATAARARVPANQAETAQSASSPTAIRNSETVDAPAAPASEPVGSTVAGGTTSVAERTVSSSNHPVISTPNTTSPPTMMPFKLARPANLQAAQASTLTLNEADGVIVPDSATLPPPGYPHHSMASTTRSNMSKASDKPSHLGVPAAAAAGGAAALGAGAAAVSHNRTDSTTDLSRPSTADPTSSRPISPGADSAHESIVDAQPAQAQAVRLSHARVSSKGSNLDVAAMSKLANADNEHPPVPATNGDATTRADLEREMTPKTNGDHSSAGLDAIPAPELGTLRGGQQSTGGDLTSAQDDSNNWASDVMRDVEDAGSRSATRDGPTEERPGIERFVTANQL